MRTAIVVCTDGSYIEPSAVLLQSFADNYHSKKDVDLVCVMPEGESEKFDYLSDLLSLDLRLHLKLVVAKDSDYGWMKSLVNSQGKNIFPSLWYRCFLGSLLPDYDKAIYFDSDIFIDKNVQPILDYPMNGKLMAVYDTVGVPWLYGIHQGTLAHFLSGVLIIDLAWWRDSGVEEKFKAELLSEGPNELLDEYLLNKYLFDRWFPIPITFNFHSYLEDDHGIPDWDSSYLAKGFYNDAIVYHFSGQAKPWNFKEIGGKDDESLLGQKWRDALTKLKNNMTLGNKKVRNVNGIIIDRT